MIDFLAAVTIPIPGITADIDPTGIAVKLLVLVPLVGGYLLARNAKNNTPMEIAGIALLVLATVVPVNLTADGLATTWPAFVARWPLAFFILGIAFVQDKGLKSGVGAILVVLSGLIAIPTR